MSLEENEIGEVKPSESGSDIGGEAQGSAASETPKNPKFRWYVVHTYSGFEDRAKTTLLERIRNARMEAKFGEIIVPTTVKESITKSGKKKQVTRTQFPGYMLVEMDLTDESMVLVRETPRITGFIGNQRSPRPLPDHEVLKLTAPEQAIAQDVGRQVPEILFEKGEGVKVIDGPFSNFDGIVDEVKPDKARLRVLVSIFGRETPVELEYKQVEKLH